MRFINEEIGLVSEAQQLFKISRYRESLKICETLYITRPSNIDNLVLLGAIHFQLRNLSESIFYSQQCLRVDQTCAEAYITIGCVCFGFTNRFPPKIVTSNLWRRDVGQLTGM